MRLMYDSTTPWDIPRDAEMIAFYVDGLYAWKPEWLNMFPNAVKVSISAIGARTAHVGDVEPGCIWPPRNAVPWVLRARADGIDPTIYTNERNDWGSVRQAFRDAGVREPHYWVANYDGVRVLPSGAVAKQFAWPPDSGRYSGKPWETGKHYDLNIVADYWPGVDEVDDSMNQNQEQRLMEIHTASMDLLRTVVNGDYGDQTYGTVSGLPKLHEHVNFLGDRIADVEAKLNEPAPVVITPEQIAEIRTGLATEIADILAERLKD